MKESARIKLLDNPQMQELLLQEWTPEYVETLELNYGWAGVAHNHNIAVEAAKMKRVALPKQFKGLTAAKRQELSKLMKERWAARKKLMRKKKSK